MEIQGLGYVNNTKLFLLPRQPSQSLCLRRVSFNQTRIWISSERFSVVLFLLNMHIEDLFSRLVTSGPDVSAQTKTKKRESAKNENKGSFIQPTVAFSLILLLSQFDELGAENGTVTGYDLKRRRFLPGG